MDIDKDTADFWGIKQDSEESKEVKEEIKEVSEEGQEAEEESFF